MDDSANLITAAAANTSPKEFDMRIRTLLCAATAFALLSGCSASSPEKPSQMASSVLKIYRLTEGGHGSGVYIGNGIVLTAAHVVDGQARMMIQDDQGLVLGADVLWANKEYDVAAIRPDKSENGDGFRWVDTARLECRTIERGEPIVAAGNPGSEDNLYMPGTVVGNERESGPWKSVVLVAVPISVGSSGGPVFDVQGDMVGIVVGGQLTPIQVGADEYVPSVTGVAYIVPSSAICGLLGKGDVG